MLSFVTRVARETGAVYWALVKVVVPVMLLVRLAVEFGLIGYVAAVFEPFMALVGLPAEMGIVWATACLVNIYGGAAALMGVLPQAPLTVAQMTVLLTMVLVAHSLPVEQRVCQRAGAGLLFTTLLRLGGAVVLGAILAWTYDALGVLEAPAHIAWMPESDARAPWGRWLLNSAESLAWLFIIILALITLLRLFDALGVTDLVSRLMRPALRAMGMSPAATPVSVVGVLLGLSYGGGLIIREAEAGALPTRDAVLSLSLMALCHALIEDSLFVMALGAHWSGVLLARPLFAVLVVAIMARLIHSMDDATVLRWLASPAGRKQAALQAAE